MAVDTLPPRAPAPPPDPEEVGTGKRRGPLRLLSELRVNRWGVAGLLLALTLVSLYLRTRQIHFYYWIDEAISVGISSHPLSQLPHLLREDGSPPLYYVLLHFWMRLFGRGEVATHWLSLIFALVTVPASYWAGSSLFGRRTGAYAAILAAGVPFLTSYGQETRMYSLLALLSLLVAASFVHLFVYRRRRYLPLFSLSLAASLYTHNWALFLGLATFLAYLFCVRSTPAPRRDLWRDGLIGFGAVAVLYLPWLPTLLYQARHTGAPWALPPVVWSLSQGFYFIVGGRGAAVALLLAGGAGLLAGSAGLFAGRSGALIGGRRAAGPGDGDGEGEGDGDGAVSGSANPGEEQRRDRSSILSLAIIGLGTLLIAWVYAKTTPAWSGRYLAVIVGPLTLLVALGLSRARGLGICALALVCCFWVLDPRSTALDAKSNVALVARAVRHQTGPDTLVLSTQPEQIPALAYYLPDVRRFATPLGAVPDPRVMDWRNALEQFERSSVRTVLAPMIRTLRPGDTVLLVVPEDFQKAPMWMKLIHRSSVRWERYLRHDRSLRVIKDTSPRQFSSGLPVRGVLFAVKR
jgi:mannosyltransferase